MFSLLKQYSIAITGVSSWLGFWRGRSAWIRRSLSPQRKWWDTGVLFYLSFYLDKVKLHARLSQHGGKEPVPPTDSPAKKDIVNSKASGLSCLLLRSLSLFLPLCDVLDGISNFPRGVTFPSNCHSVSYMFCLVPLLPRLLLSVVIMVTIAVFFLF